MLKMAGRWVISEKSCLLLQHQTLALPKQGLKKFVEHSDLVLFMEIFSKRQKI